MDSDQGRQNVRPDLDLKEFSDLFFFKEKKSADNKKAIFNTK